MEAESGRSLGYTPVWNEQAANAWANTLEEKLAYRWAQTGEWQRLVRCEDQALTRDRQQGRSVCLAKKGSGWWIP